MVCCLVVFFFFQAEDGIRDGHVTGVQTCALPISSVLPARGSSGSEGVRPVSSGGWKTRTGGWKAAAGTGGDPPAGRSPRPAAPRAAASWPGTPGTAGMAAPAAADPVPPGGASDVP